MVKVSENLSEDTGNIKKVLKGSAISIIVTLIALLIFSLMLTYTNIQEKVIPTVIIIITSLSILIGGSLTTSNIKKSGIINGGLVGLIYILAIYLLSSITTKTFSFSTHSIIMIICSVLAGGLGGIIGINMK